MTDEVLILKPEDEQAQLIARAIASPTAGSILTILTNGPKNSSEISNELSLPIPTIQYHIRNLLEAGIIEIAYQKFSIKGKEVKYYRQRERLFIVTSKPASVRDTLMRYGIISCIVIVSGLIMRAFIENEQLSKGIGGSEMMNAQDSFSMAAVPAVMRTAETPGIDLTPVLSFLTGGFLVLALFLIFDLIRALRIKGLQKKRTANRSEVQGDSEDSL